jgi:hypothetical protein
MAEKDTEKPDDGAKASAGKSLNEQNWPGLLAITGFNLVIFGVVAAADPRWYSDLNTAWAFLLPAGVGLAMLRVVNGLIDARGKDVLVFWKWRYPLPGFKAFSVYAKGDYRFRESDVLDKLRALNVDPDSLRKDPAGQNAYWYGHVFSPLQDKPSVQQVARNFLFTRDYTAISFVMLIALGVAGYFVITPTTRWQLYCGGLILQYLLVSRAARVYGVETVKNALAVWVFAK